MKIQKKNWGGGGGGFGPGGGGGGGGGSGRVGGRGGQGGCEHRIKVFVKIQKKKNWKGCPGGGGGGVRMDVNEELKFL